jgi:hypothetical protein
LTRTLMLREKDNCHSTNSNYPWGNAVSLISAVWMFILYCVAAKYEERAFLECSLRSSYASYLDSKGMFLPKIRLSSTREKVV